jgi:hypothetical protein
MLIRSIRRQSMAILSFMLLVSHVACQLDDKLFLERCQFYTTQYLPSLFEDFAVDCKHSLSLFQNSFDEGLALALESPDCTVPQSLFSKSVPSLAHPLPENVKFMLWSRVDNEIIKKAGSCQGKQFFHMGCTLIGHIFNDNNWCGQPDYPVKDPSKCDCHASAVEYAMWKEASKYFAEEIKGEIYILLNGSMKDRPSYGGPSVLRDIELPELFRRGKEEIKGFTVFMTHSESIKQETCESAPVNELKELITENGYPFRCFDDPDFATFEN